MAHFNSNYFYVVAITLLSLLLLFVVQSTIAGNNAWSQVGLAGETSEALAIDPNNPNIVYAGTGTGLFKTDDGGTTWIQIGTGVPNMDDISGIAVDPGDSNTIYVSTHWDPLYRSANGGTDWMELDVPSSFTVAVSPLDSNIVLSGNGAISRSPDSGKTWEKKIVSGLGGVRAFAFSPSSPNIVYVGSFDGIWRSADSGATWTSANGGFVTPPRIYAVAIDPQDNQIAYIGTAHDGIYKTLDGGQSWSSVSMGLNSSTIYTIAVDPYNRNIVYAGAGETGILGVYKSIDQGQTWSPMMEGMGPKSVFVLAIGGKSPKNLFAAVRTGVWKYSDSASNTFLPIILNQ